MAFANVRQGIQMLAAQLQQLIDALKGTPGRGQRISLTNLASASDYSLTIQNTGTGGKGLLVRDSSGNTLLDVTNTGVSMGSPSFTTAIQVPVDSTSGNLDPEYTFTGDTDTGMYSSAANTLHLVTGGSNRVTVDSSGNVGIGGAPGAYALDVTGQVRSSTGLIVTAGGALVSAGDIQATTGAFLAAVDATSGNLDPEYSFIGDTNTGMYSSAADTLHLVTGGSNRVTIDSSGNVGIGGAPGSFALDVTGQIRSSAALTVTAGGITVTAGGVVVTAGGATITAGGLAVNGGGIALGASGGGLTFNASNASNLTMGTGQIVAKATAAASSVPYTFSGDTDVGLSYEGTDSVALAVGGAAGLIVASNKSIYAGGSPGSMLTTATGPFLYLTGASGAPSGVPTNRTSNSQFPVYYDSGSGTIYVHNGTSWGSLTATATGITANATANTDTTIAANRHVTLNSNLDAGTDGDIRFQNNATTKITIPYLSTAGGVFEMGHAATPAAANPSTTRVYVKSDDRLYIRGVSTAEAEPDAVGASQYAVKVGTGTNAATWTTTPRLANGVVTAPSYSFANMTGGGMWLTATTNDWINFATYGHTRLRLGGGSSQVQVAPGAVGAPGLSWLTTSVGGTETPDGNTGFYYISADTFGVSCGGSAIMSWSNTGTSLVTRFSDGTAAAPGISFINNTNCGIFNSSGSIQTVYAGSPKILVDSTVRIDSSTTFGSSSAAPTALVYLYQAGEGGNSGLRFRHTTGEVWDFAAYNPGGASMNMLLQYQGGNYYMFKSDGTVGKPGGDSTWTNTSDRRTKKNFRPFDDGLDVIRKLPKPQRFEFNGRGNTNENESSMGLIAQDLVDIYPTILRAPQLGRLDPDDEEMTEIMQLNVSPLTWVFLNALKELDQKVEALYAKCEAR